MDILVDLLTVQDADDRKIAAQLLGLRLEVHATAMLRVAARDPAPAVRAQALHSLGELRDKGGVGGVITALSDKVAAVRHAALLASGKLGDLSALPAVLQCLHDSDEKVVAAAAASLHQLQGEGALEALVEVALASVSELVQRGAVASLARWSDPAEVHAALRSGGVFGKAPKGVGRQQWAEVRAAGCEIIGHLFHCEDGAEAPPVGASSALTTLVDEFRDRDEGIRLQAVVAAGKMRLCEALNPLMPLLQERIPPNREDPAPSHTAHATTPHSHTSRISPTQAGLSLHATLMPHIQPFTPPARSHSASGLLSSRYRGHHRFHQQTGLAPLSRPIGADRHGRGHDQASQGRSTTLPPSHRRPEALLR